MEASQFAYLLGYLKILTREFIFLLSNPLIFAHLDKVGFTDVLSFCEAETCTCTRVIESVTTP